jgi:hypothetical protein
MISGFALPPAEVTVHPTDAVGAYQPHHARPGA